MSAPFHPTVARPSLVWRLRFVLSNALLPLAVIAMTAGTLLWGPYVALVITAVAWRLVTRCA